MPSSKWVSGLRQDARLLARKIHPEGLSGPEHANLAFDFLMYMAKAIEESRKLGLAPLRSLKPGSSARVHLKPKIAGTSPASKVVLKGETVTRMHSHRDKAHTTQIWGVYSIPQRCVVIARVLWSLRV